MGVRIGRATALVGISLGSIAGSLGLAACGRSPATSGSSNSRHPQERATSDEITTAKVGRLGSVLVNGRGYTVYLFIPDHASGHSTCYGICAVQWPPVTLPSTDSTPLAGRGVTPSLLGVTKRTDGTKQVTYGGWPLYLWPNDTSPGQATGEGVNNRGGLWYVVSPKGTPIR